MNKRRLQLQNILLEILNGGFDNLWLWDTFNFETGVIGYESDWVWDTFNFENGITPRFMFDSVYFQPPESVKMTYPAIVYEVQNEYVRFADNLPYKRKKRYLITVIDKNPDSEIPDRVGSLPFSEFSRTFTASNLNHTLYYLYY